jgi:hypothetical protein
MEKAGCNQIAFFFQLLEGNLSSGPDFNDRGLVRHFFCPMR